MIGHENEIPICMKRARNILIASN